MTSTKPIFIVQTDFNYKQSLLLTQQILEHNYPVMVYLYENKLTYDMYYKYIGIIQKEFNHTSEKTVFYTPYQTLPLNILQLFYANKILMSYDKFIFINPNSLYLNKFFNLLDKFKEYDFCGIKPYQSADLNLTLHTTSQYHVRLLSRKIIDYLISKNININKTNPNNIPDNFKSTEYLSNYIIGFEHNNVCKYNVDEDKFKLLYLVENSSSSMKDSYCFLYNENMRCMNLENNIAGTFTVVDDLQIDIIWNHGTSAISRYLKSDTDNYYRLINVSEHI